MMIAAGLVVSLVPSSPGFARDPLAVPTTGMEKQEPNAPGARTRPILPQELTRIRRILGEVQGTKRRPAVAPEGALALTLEDSVKLALEKNLNLQIAELNKEALEPEIDKARGLFDPTIGAGVNGAGDREVHDGRRVSDVRSQTGTAFLAEALPTGGSVSLSSDLGRTETVPRRRVDIASAYAVSVVQPLLRGGRVYVATRPIRDAESDVRIEEARLRAQVLGVVVQTKAAYYDAVVAEKIVAVTIEALGRDEALIDASGSLFRGGLVTKRDVFSAEIIRAEDRENLAKGQGQSELAYNHLRDVLGLPIDAELQLLDGDIEFEPVRLELESWIRVALERRPEILAAEESIRKSSLDVRVAQNTVLPQLNLVGSYGGAETGSTLGRSLDLGGEQWMGGFLFSVPIGNIAARASLAQAKIHHARLEQELLQSKRQVELQVRAAVIKLRTSLEKMKALATEVEQAKGKLEIAKARFALGVATNLDITDAQEKILGSEVDLLQTIVDYDVGLAELEASIAGSI